MIRVRPHLCFSLFCILVATLFSTAVTALEGKVLNNGGFDRDLSGWEETIEDYRSTEWNPLDARGCSESGSTLLYNLGTWILIQDQISLHSNTSSVLISIGVYKPYGEDTSSL